MMNDPVTDIRETLSHARLCCEAWWQLEGAHQHREIIVQGFNSFPLLFETVRPALFVCFVVKICSLFGTGRHDITLRSLPLVEQDPEFARIWDRGRDLYRYRSKVIAHRDAFMDPNVVAKETGFTFAELRSFAEDVRGLFDRVAYLLKLPGLPDVDGEEEVLEAARRLAAALMA